MAYAVTTIGGLGDVTPLARANPTRGYPCNAWTANVPPRNLGDPATPTPESGDSLDAWAVVGIAVGGALLGAAVTMYFGVQSCRRRTSDAYTRGFKFGYEPEPTSSGRKRKKRRN